MITIRQHKNGALEFDIRFRSPDRRLLRGRRALPSVHTKDHAMKLGSPIERHLMQPTLQMRRPSGLDSRPAWTRVSH